MNGGKINFGRIIVLIHHSITRGLNVSIGRSTAYMQTGYPDAAMRDGFIIFERTLGWLINAHHKAEDNIIFPYMRSKLPNAPFDGLSADHKVIDELLKKIQTAVDELSINARTGDALKNLHDALTDISKLWHPHIAKEQIYIYDTKIVDSVMEADEQARLGGEAAQYSFKQADQRFLIPYILYNLNNAERVYIAQTMPPVVMQELMPGDWKEKWEPMIPFFLE